MAVTYVEDLKLTEEEVAHFAYWVEHAYGQREQLRKGEGLWNYAQRGVSRKYPKFGKLSESQLRRLAKQQISGLQKLDKEAQRYKAAMVKRNPLTPEIVDEAHRKDREARAFLAIISIMDSMGQLHPDSLGRLVHLVNWYAERKKEEKYPE